MLLSSMSFARNCQFSDFIISKIKEDQDKRDRKEAKKLKKKINRKLPFVRSNASTVTYKKVKSDEQTEKCLGDVKQSISEYRSPDETLKFHEPRTYFTIETFDGFVVDMDINKNKIFLTRKECSRSSCHFERIVLGETGSDDKTTKSRKLTEAFQLRAMPSFYISHSDETLQIKKFDPEKLEADDSRWFSVDENSSGFSNLQPLGKRGRFVHHMDDVLSVRRLEVNWRPPEEYLFRFVEVVEKVDPDSDFGVMSTLTSGDIGIVDLAIPDPVMESSNKKKQKWRSVKSTVSKWRKMTLDQRENKVKIRR